MNGIDLYVVFRSHGIETKQGKDTLFAGLILQSPEGTNNNRFMNSNKKILPQSG
jgi:hypothetical protein